ncbi:MAG: hypothetical protein Faunusvirus17_5 [Faunusvirus sp.]|jgi:hypothetical protein|uniref:Uncharacterized protein n=1 Tax=Faunusvirus sp. TaxID=2487766 RepID=A0A3G4ZX60_9VIRU|nr:MAG: hypothetical protein Faunusvirus17_5 [Faunusvirus sp.]
MDSDNNVCYTQKTNSGNGWCNPPIEQPRLTGNTCIGANDWAPANWCYHVNDSKDSVTADMPSVPYNFDTVESMVVLHEDSTPKPDKLNTANSPNGAYLAGDMHKTDIQASAGEMIVNSQYEGKQLEPRDIKHKSCHCAKALFGTLIICAIAGVVYMVMTNGLRL